MRKKIKLAYFISSLDQQGPVNVLLNIISYIDFDQYDITIILLKDNVRNSMYDKFCKFPIKFIFLRHVRWYNPFGVILEILKTINYSKPDIIHAHCFPSLFLASIMSIFFRKIVYIYTLHIYPSIQTIAMQGLVKGSIINIMSKFLISNLDIVICCSKSLQNELKSKDGIDSIAIQNGINIIDKSGIDYPESDIPSFAGKRVFVSIGRLSNEKNFNFLIKAFKDDYFKDAVLLILGDGVLSAVLSNVKCNNVYLFGFKKDISPYLQRCDYYISASYVEGLPISVLEAMSLGKPLILSSIPQHLEILNVLDKSGVSGSFVNDNLDSLIENISRVSINESNSQYIIDKFNQCFSAKKMSTNYQNVYSQSVNLK